ncbi:hypothetical protein WN944_012190 [Citrus x changshan-huyou]|uniref:Uncharacterized protein n=2 Tax=Citrus TaxID=2706 RepID=A0A067G885_CITSI|nr:hypothetical protein CISIN_1g041404mg [Citrus sinensis]
MAYARRGMINGGNISQRLTAGGGTGRLIPKRGQVKLAILVGLAHSVASIFSHSHSNRPASASPHFS